MRTYEFGNERDLVPPLLVQIGPGLRVPANWTPQQRAKFMAGVEDYFFAQLGMKKVEKGNV